MFSEMQGCGLPLKFSGAEHHESRLFGDVCPSCCLSPPTIATTVQSAESTIAELSQTFILLPKTSPV